MGFLFILGSDGNYDHASRHVAALLRAVWKGLSCATSKYVGSPVYIISTSDPGHWTTPSSFLSTLKSYLDAEGVSYTVLDTYDKIYSTLWVSQPSNAIIINTHGEGHPIPPQKYVIYDTTSNSFVSNYVDLAKQYYADLGAMIRDKGWLVIEPIGYAYYNAMQYGHCTCEKGAIGTSGLNSLLSAVGLSSDCWGSTAYNVIHSCALRRTWKSEWGSITYRVVRFVKPVGSFSPWQYNFRGGSLVYMAGAVAMGEPPGALLF